MTYLAQGPSEDDRLSWLGSIRFQFGLVGYQLDDTRGSVGVR